MSAGPLLREKGKIDAAPESKAFAPPLPTNQPAPADQIFVPQPGEELRGEAARGPTIAKINGNQREELIDGLIARAITHYHKLAFAKITSEQLHIIAHKYLSDDILRIMTCGGTNEPLFTDLCQAVSIEDSAKLSQSENLIYGYNFQVCVRQLREWSDSKDKTKTKIASGVFGRMKRHNLESLITDDTRLNLKYVGYTSDWPTRNAVHLARQDGCNGFNSLMELDSKPRSRILFACETKGETLVAEALVASLLRSSFTEGGGVNMIPCGGAMPFYRLVLAAKALVNAGEASESLDAECWQESYWSELHAYGSVIGVTQPTTVTELHSIMTKRAHEGAQAVLEAGGKNDEGKFILSVERGLMAGAVLREAADATDIRRMRALKKRHKTKPFQSLREAQAFLASTKLGVGKRAKHSGPCVHVRELMARVDKNWDPDPTSRVQIQVYSAARKKFRNAKTKEDLISEINNSADINGRATLYYALSEGSIKRRQPMATKVVAAIEKHYCDQEDESDRSDDDTDSDCSDADTVDNEIAVDETKVPVQCESHSNENKSKRKRSPIVSESDSDELPDTDMQLQTEKLGAKRPRLN
jgi:hypothetical protein